MNRVQALLILSVVALLMEGCAAQHYRPRPISPFETAAKIEARTLNDSGLKDFIEKSLAHPLEWPPKEWDLRLLTLAAFYFNSQIQAARDQFAFAQASQVTAAMRPNPTLSFSPGIPSPYLISLDFLVPVVTAGKRRYQIETAKNLSEAARLNLAETLWAVRNGVRSALLNDLAAERNLDVFRVEEQQRSERVVRIGEQVQAGELARPVLAASQLTLINTQLAVRSLQGRLAQAKAALAAAIGVPISGLANARFAWEGFEQLPSRASLSLQQVQRDAIVNRLDVRQALARYQAAESALQLEIARQYPNFQIGPGYQFEEGHSFFAPALSIQLPIFNKNEGPIAQAEALRKEAAANLVATEQQVIAQSEEAWVSYRAAYTRIQDARKALANMRLVQEPMARRAYVLGQSDWLTLNSVRLAGAGAAAVWLNAVDQAQAALGQLEMAVQRPLEAGDAVPLAFVSSPAQLSPEERKK